MRRARLHHCRAQSRRSCKILKTRRLNKITNFLAYLAHHALKKAFIPLAMAAEEASPSRIEDSGDVVALLEQEAAAGIDQYRARKFYEILAHAPAFLHQLSALATLIAMRRIIVARS